ncbi:MAG: O-acetylhomoserine sulfhydrylase [Porphyromonadaceae bacterium CG2_30_38_12]|nr:MAG: O-acetylhomoserine sulfhydrylase [Porphyromonadaceae bacterium CG2_30_38_12]
MNELSFDTQVLHTPYAKPDAYNALSMPIYNTAAYEFETAEAMEAAFTGRSTHHTYSRITNPTVQYFEDRVCQITGALSVTALNSGMAAISNAFFCLAQQGSNIVTSKYLFGNTYSFFVSTMASYGVEVRFCDLTQPTLVEQLIDENTCAVFLEIITNPQLIVADIAALSAICKLKNVPLVADTTVVPFCAFRAKNFGVDIELVSSTKYISGGATSLGGLIVDYGTFNPLQLPKLKVLAQSFGNKAFMVKLRSEIHRNLGAYMTPQVAYMQTLGLETMSVRYQKATQNCLTLVHQLADVKQIQTVNYPILAQNKFFDVSANQFGLTAGAMFTFNLDSRQTCFSFLNKLKLIKRATNLFDNKTLAIHPASTIYGNFSDEVRNAMLISQQSIRISVGLEAVDDLYHDIIQALN